MDHTPGNVSTIDKVRDLPPEHRSDGAFEEQTVLLQHRTALAQAAPAASPPAPAGNAGHYRFRVGDIAATVLSDGLIGGPPRVYASDASEAELQEILRRAFLPTTA